MITPNSYAAQMSQKSKDKNFISVLESRNNTAIAAAVSNCAMPRETTTRAHARRSRTRRELTEERARWRYRRRSPDLRRTKIAHHVFERNKRPYQTGRRRTANHVDLWRRRLEIGFLFRTLPLFNNMPTQPRKDPSKF